MLEYQDRKRELACLERKLGGMAATLREAANRLSGSDPERDVEFPAPDQCGKIVRDLYATRDKIRLLKSQLSNMGVELS